jgi:hypothetical protein
MDTSNTLLSVLEVCLEAFASTQDSIDAAIAASNSERSKRLNFAIDTAKGEGLTPEEIVKTIDTMVFAPAVDGGFMSFGTRANYKTGLRKALYHGVAWFPKAYSELEAIPAVDRASTKGSKKKAITGPTVKVDSKARAMTFTVPKGIELNDASKGVMAILSEPGRMALFTAWTKAHGWVK